MQPNDELLESIQDSDLDAILDDLEDLSSTSTTTSPGQASEEISRGELVLERLDSALDNYSDAADIHDAPVMEGIHSEIHSLMYSMGIDASKVAFESAETDLRGLAFKAALEDAIQVAQESWSVKDLWDSAGAVERNAVELRKGLKALDGLKGWYNENATVINSLGLLTFLTVNNKRVESVSRAVNHSSEVIDKIWSVADQAMEAFSEQERLLLTESPKSLEDVQRLLEKVIAVKNPATVASSTVNNAVTMGNQLVTVTTAPVGNRAGAELGEWSLTVRVKASNMGHVPTSATTKFARVPAWLAGFAMGVHVGSALADVATSVVPHPLAKAVVSVTGTLAVGLVYGAAMTAGVDAINTGLKEKHFVDKADMDRGLLAILKSADKAAQHRRKYPNVWRAQSKSLDEFTKHTGQVASELTGDAKSLYNTVVGLVKNTHRLGWDTAAVAFDLSRLMVTGANSTVAKLVKAAKK